MLVNSSGHEADQASVLRELTFWWGRQAINKDEVQVFLRALRDTIR